MEKESLVNIKWIKIHLTVLEEKDMTRGLPGTLGTSGDKLASVNLSTANQLNIGGNVYKSQNSVVVLNFSVI